MLVTIAGRPVHVNEEGFLTDAGEWDEAVAAALAADIGLTLSDDHLAVIRFVRRDFAERGTSPTLRRVSSVGGFEIKRLFVLFPKKPAKKMSYVAGVPKPIGCV